MVAALDDNVGRVLDAVKAAGETDNTIIYFASDNGCAAYFPGLCSCTPLRGGKLSHYEGGTRVPFMMRWPGHIQPGIVYHEVVSLLDVLPTSVGAAGGRLPMDRVYDGVDLMPYLTGKKTGALTICWSGDGFHCFPFERAIGSYGNRWMIRQGDRANTSCFST